MLERKKVYDKNFYYIFIFITIISLSSILYISKQKDDRLTGYYQENIEKLEVAYSASINTYQLIANMIYNSNITKPEHLKTLYQAFTAQDENKKRYYKGLFYKELYPIYEEIQKLGIRQLHFQLPDNSSFLRFHNPARFGDDLTIHRPSVAYVNKTKKPITVFETGRVVSGFRNLFPVSYQDIYLGSVEISSSVKSIVNSMNSLLPEHEFIFLLKADLINHKIFHSQDYLYSKSILNENFVQEDSNAILEDSPTPLSTTAKRINQLLMQDSNIKNLMSENKKFAQLIALENSYYNVIFLPVFGMQNKLEGYLVSYDYAQNMPPIVNLLPWIIAAIAITYIISLFLLIGLGKKSQELSEQKNWFLDVTESLGDGLYVVDIHANIIYINPKACEILEYPQEELLGKSAHYIFHCHEENEHLPLEECPIFKSVAEDGYKQSLHETFKTKSGNTVWVELTSKALYKDGCIYQIITSFKDVTIRKRLEDKMKLLTKALESSSDAIILTDKDAFIEWANPAFETLTGYRLTEVLGKKPKEFISSGKQSAQFYKDLWDTILAKRPWSGEIINKRKDGSFYYEELRITPVLDAHKNIKNFIAIKQDISERKEKEKNIEHFAYYDFLTSLPNRRLFSEHLGQISKSLVREKRYIALMLIDLDKFKTLNDTLGHDYGDELLKEVAIRLQSKVRENDIVARLGGDEFVVILDNLLPYEEEAKESCKKIAEKLLATTKEPFILKDKRYNTSISIGIYLFNESDRGIEHTIKKADIALYEAKGKGRNTFCFFNNND
jgi:diguanylate cyclase (GGDEF)-like protein/PAS domain S-box-containing protein